MARQRRQGEAIGAKGWRTCKQFRLGVFTDYVKLHSSIAVWGIQEHTWVQHCMRDIASLLDGSPFLKQVKDANLNAGHVDDLRSSSSLGTVHLCPALRAGQQASQGCPAVMLPVTLPRSLIPKICLWASFQKIPQQLNSKGSVMVMDTTLIEYNSNGLHDTC
ncbi:MAG: hypothetical protein FRX49_01275 [Trebouxia sp. A1-2]|nr:MAG: hypothetical protein FRX49_01275 [Trebouxia sp. A1-2]